MPGKNLFPWGLTVGLLLFSWISESSAQIVVRGGIPRSFELTTKATKIIPALVMDSLSRNKFLKEDQQKNIPNRFAITKDTTIDLREAGVRTKTDDGGTIWQYELKSPGARSIGVIFREFDLPEDAELYLYSPDKKRVVGAFTRLNNKDGKMPIAQFPGDRLILEYDEPAHAAYKGELVIGSILQAYRDLSTTGSNTASVSADSLRIGINCPEGDPWQTEKRSVCLMTFQDGQYGYFCTGFLVNNVREDGTPYFMTANHCINTNSVASTLITYFNYENSTCNSNDANPNQSLAGATLKATNSHSDFTLLELTEYPPDSYQPYYAGWDATGNQPTEGTCIHHPQGHPKCIAIGKNPISYDGIINWDNTTTTAPNTHWEISFDKGGTESGSSGSPLFDQNARVIGQLHGGDDTSSFYGKFSLSWNYNSLPNAQLAHWLDPDNTGTLKLDGQDNQLPPAADFSTETDLTCLDTPVFLLDKSEHTPTSWLWKIRPATFQFVNETDSTFRNPDVLFTSEGTYTITLIASNEYGSDTMTYKNIVTAVATLPVSFTTGTKELTVCGSDLINFRLTAEGAPSYKFKVGEPLMFTQTTNGPTLTLTLKDAFKSQGSFDTYVKVTGSYKTCAASDSLVLHVTIPENDYIANAIPLHLGNNGPFSNECGTVEANEPSPPDNGCSVANNWCPDPSLLDNTIWFTFTGPSSGMVTIDAEGFDDQIAVYDANSYEDILSGKASNYSVLAANDNRSTSETSAYIENLSVVPGHTYWLQLDGSNGATGEANIKLISNSLELYPNPTTGLFSLIISAKNANDKAYLEIFNLQGQKLYAGNLTKTKLANTFNFDMSGFSNGMYIVKVSVTGATMTKKIMLLK
jgi:PKD repeat protein